MTTRATDSQALTARSELGFWQYLIGLTQLQDRLLLVGKISCSSLAEVGTGCVVVDCHSCLCLQGTLLLQGLSWQLYYPCVIAPDEQCACVTAAVQLQYQPSNYSVACGVLHCSVWCLWIACSGAGLNLP